MSVIRKLVAVVAADVVGYSRLMERDEAGTHERLRALTYELITPKIAEYGGRTVKTSGDGMLLEFPSATSALRCAVEIQREMGKRNLSIARDQRIEFRIGINLGDIIVEGDDIIGDGVNIAARLEALAEPGGICVASAILDQLHEDLGVEFVDAGDQRVKNINKPIHVYRVALERGTGASRAQSAAAPSSQASPFRRPVAIAGTVALVAMALVAAWYALRRDAGSPMLGDALPLRSVMIAPFTSPADEAALAAKASLLTADLTRALGDDLRDVRVVAPSVAERYAGRIADTKTVGREANVRFIIEGDMRPSGGQVAITLRLVDTSDGRQLESARKVVDRTHLDDPGSVVRQLAVAARTLLVSAIGRNLAAGGAKADTAQDLVDRGWSVPLADPVMRAREWRRLADAAIKLEPTFARAWALRTAASIDLYFFDFATEPAPLIADADADSLRAVTLDPRDVNGWCARGNALRIRGNMEAAFAALDRAQELDPIRIWPLFDRGWAHLDAGEPAETLKVVAKVRELKGRGADDSLQACMAHAQLGAYERAIAECNRVETAWPVWHRHAYLAAAHALRGDAAKAAEAKNRLLAAVPGFTIARYQTRFYPTSTPESIALDEAHLVPGLRKAGVPE